MIDFELVDPETLKTCLTGVKGDRPVLLEAHFSSIDHPLQDDKPPLRHLPGAIQVHPSYLEAGRNESGYYPFYQSPEDGNLLPHDELVDALEALGIRPDSFVVVYGSEPDGTMAAARLIWGLMVAGVKKIRLLDGGFEAWLARGGPTVTEVKKATNVANSTPSVNRRTSFRVDWQAHPEFLATTSEVREMTRLNGSAPVRLIDVRNVGEYDGTLKDFYPFFSKAGHIPGAVFQGNWDTLVDRETQKIGPKLEDVRRRWSDAGIIDENVERGATSLIFYCGTGWRSSIPFLIAILLGFRAKNYDDGFYGWSWQEENEIALGGPG